MFLSYKPKYKNVYFTGVAGTGMSGLSQFQVMSGGFATGSDRAIDRGAAKDISEKLTSVGVTCPTLYVSVFSCGSPLRS